MNVVALLSGGKDSCYAILKAHALGYVVVAVAHILPPCEEADSFMYQSVGSSVVPNIASALNLPLVTVSTSAQAKQTTLTYKETTGDEVEDLVTLLRLVKSKYPAVQAVCSGALWSDYQRLRVENAASRVGLLSLAPMWRRSQAELLDEMIEAGVEAVIIKVAGIGLNHSHLGKSLADLRPILLALESKYGSHVCGEGGEYESLVTWMPGFHQRLVLDQVEVVPHSEDPIAPVAFLRFLKTSLHSLTDEQHNRFSSSKMSIEKHPPLFQFEPKFYDSDVVSNADDQSMLHDKSGFSLQHSIGANEKFLCITVHSDCTGAQGIQSCCDHLSDCLSKQGESLNRIVFLQLHLSRVDGAAYIDGNNVYKKIFERLQCVAPPSRACVALPSGNYGTVIEALVRRGDRVNVQSLHVQSLSEWAPPCIGPYSQFVEEDGVVHVSGVLPLYPPTASILKGMPASKQVQICAENMRRTLEAGRSGIRMLGLFQVYTTAASIAAEIEQVLAEEFGHGRSVVVILPVSALPKGALVEIKAVGVIEDVQLYIPVLCADLTVAKEMGIKVEVVVCYTFLYVVCSGMRADGDIKSYVDQSLKLAPHLDTREKNNHPLAFQMYTTKEVGVDGFKQWFQSSFPSTALSMFLAPWLAKDASWQSIATFALR